MQCESLLLDLFAVLNKILGEEGQEERMTEDERERRKEELRKEREEQGLPMDDDALDALIDQEEKEKGRQRRRVNTVDMDKKRVFIEMVNVFPCLACFLWAKTVLS